MSTPAPTQPLNWLRVAVLSVAAVLLALVPAVLARPAAEAAATVRGCPYGYLCLYEGYNYTGKLHPLYNCEHYYVPYAFHSVVNNQTPNTRGNFYERNSTHTGPGRLIWTSRPPLWTSGNVDGIAGGLGARTWYVKPC